MEKKKETARKVKRKRGCAGEEDVDVIVEDGDEEDGDVIVEDGDEEVLTGDVVAEDPRRDDVAARAEQPF